MEKIINRLIDEAVVNVDKYVNNGSTWLIFTESKQWVIELTEDGTLWYNYNFFKNLFAYMSMDVVENQRYITKWVDDNIINGVKINYTDAASQKNMFVQDTLQNGVKSTLSETSEQDFLVEKTIQNGVKHTDSLEWKCGFYIEDTIQNGVKHTSNKITCEHLDIEDTIKYGVKNTDWSECHRPVAVDDTTHNGVKETNVSPTFTEYGDWLDGDERLDDIIENGVKRTQNNPFSMITNVENTIQNGVKETNPVDVMKFFDNKMEDTIQNGVKEIKLGAPDNRDYFIEDAIQNGIKKTKTPIDGCLTSTMEWMDENETNSVPKLIDYVVKYGVKQTKAMDEWVNAESIVDKTMKDGVKSTKPGGYLGSIEMKGKIVHQLESPKQNNEVEDVIQHGVIETFDETHHRRREVVRTIRDGIKQTCAQIPSIDAVVERVVEEGIKETHDDVYHHTARVEGVIRNGIKEVKGLPDMSGELRGYGDYYRRQKDMAKPHILYVKDVIENGDKDTFKKSTY